MFCTFTPNMFFLVIINLPPVEHKFNEEACFALSEGFITASFRE